MRFSRRCCAAVHGESVGSALHLKDSPFWTLTPAYCEDIHIHDLRVTAPMDRIGNTDGVNIDSCRRVVVENVWIDNSDDGVCMKSGLDGFGLNLGIPSEDVLVQTQQPKAPKQGALLSRLSARSTPSNAPLAHPRPPSTLL